MADFRVGIHVNLGLGTTYDALSLAVRDIGSLLSFATEAQKIVDRNRVVAEVYQQHAARDPDSGLAWFPFLVFRDGRPIDLSSYELAYRSEITERLGAIDVRQIVVDSMRFENPLDLHAHFDGKAISNVLGTIRDWKADRRAANARADREEATARFYQDEADFHRSLQDILLERLSSNPEMPISREQLNDLLTDQTGSSLRRLERADVEIDVDDTSSDDQN